MQRAQTRGRGRLAGLGLGAWMALAALVWPAAANAQHTSTQCPAQTATVSAGGTVSINVTDCEEVPGNGGVGRIDGGSSLPPAPDVEDFGIAVLEQRGGQWFLDYSHTGGGVGSTDVFEFSDGSLAGDGDVRVTITINAAASPITVSPATLPTLTAGTPFSQTLTSTGGLAPYTYTLQSGVLPAGTTLTSGGVISGTPTQRGAYSFSVRSTDSTTPTAQFVDKGYTGSVQNPSLALSPTSATAVQGAPFSQTLSTSGGVSPYTYALETGSFPAGISLSSAGVISGTTSAAPGNYPVTIRVTDSSTGPGQYFEVENFTLTVAAAPSVSIAVSPASVSEDGATNLTYTVTRSVSLSSATVVNITTSGTATAGTDYTGSVATITIPAGATTATAVIDPAVDGTVEDNETVILTVATGSGYTVGAPASATGTILNDDVPSVTVSVSPANVAEDGAPNLVYTFTLNQPNPSAATSVNYTVGGTATNGTDYATIASPLVIPAGSTTGTVTVNPTADATIEANETVTLTLGAGAGYTVGVPNGATGTILNDDLPNLTINDVTASEGNAGITNFTFTVSLSAPAGPGGVTFDLATANGTATAGGDFVASSLTGQTIPAGSSTYTFTVLVNGDTLNEPSETFFANVTNVVNAVVADGQGVGTIVNDDPLPSLSIASRNIVERNTMTQAEALVVTLSAASGQSVTVSYATADGSATAGSDYVATSGTLTFAPGQTTQAISVGVTGDAIPEADETFTVTLSSPVNATIATGVGTYTIVNDDVPVTVSPATLPNGTVGAPYSQTVTAGGGTAPYTFAVTAGALPSGLTLAPGGTLSGTPTAGGTFNFTVTATDSSGAPGPFTGSRAYSVTIAAPTVTLPATPLANGTLGAAYSAAITPATGGTAPYSYAVTAGALPPGLVLSAATGAITGTPAALGTFNFSVTATDSSTGTGPYTATQSYAITVVDVAPVANPSSLTVGYNSPATAVPLVITGGTPTSLAIVAAPANGTAVVSGTTITYQPNPGYAGPDSFTYTASNSGGTSAPGTVSITVQDPTVTITASGAFNAAVATPYTQTFTFNGGNPPWSGYQVTNLPAGVSITGTTANTVTISGTPTQAGTFNLNVAATDSSTGNGPYTVGQAFALTVAAPTLALSPASGPLTASYAAPYSQVFVASGGVGPYAYALTGTLPAGLSFDGATGTLSGTPTVPGTYPLTVTATDTGSSGPGAPFSVAQSYTLDVAAPTITVNPATLPDPVVATAYSQTLTASGGAGPYAFAVTAGSLPAGLTLSSGGVLSGTTTTVGTFTFTVTATDAFGQTGARAYTVTVAAPSYTMTPGPGSLSAPYAVPYSQTFTATGGSGAFTYALTGALPAGLVFDTATGVLSGTPTAPGSYPVTVTATDTVATGAGAPFSITQAYTLDVVAPVIDITPATLPDGTAGQTYSQALAATGGAGAYTFAVQGGSLPAGLTLSSGGVLSGTPTASGTFAFTVEASDQFGQTGQRAYSLVVAVPALSLSPATLAAATAGQPFQQVLAIEGGVAPYTVVQGGTLPAGVSFDAASRTFRGTPTQSGTFNITVTVTDSTAGTPGTITRSYALVVAVPSLTLTPAPGALPAAAGGAAYSQTFVAGNGVGPYQYAVAAGALPAGLSLAPSTGVLSGTPTAAGTFSFSIRATDSTTGTPASVTQAYTLAVAAPTITITPAVLPATVLGVPYAQALTAAGGTAPYTFAVSAGALPAGIVLSSSGALSGASTQAGTFAFTVRATDALGFQGTRAYTVNVVERPDPSRDPEVRGLLEAQADTTRRFASTQITNVHSRLERLHGAGSGGGFDNGVAFSTTRRCLDRSQRADADGCDLVAANGPVASGGSDGTGTRVQSDADMAVWTAGTVRSGKSDRRTRGAASEFETEGLTLGLDRRLSDSLALGVGLGYGQDDNDVGDNGSRINAEAYSLLAYGSWHPGSGFFVDALAGYQSLDLDLRRYVTATGGLVRGRREGTQWFGSVSAGHDIARGAWQITPYGRLDISRAELDGYQERGDAIYSLAYGTQDVDTSTGSLGLRVVTARDMTWGRLLPEARLEYQRDFNADGTASMRYVDLAGGTVYTGRVTGFDRNRLMLGVGTTFALESNFSLRVEYRGLFGSEERDNALQIQVQKSY